MNFHVRVIGVLESAILLLSAFVTLLFMSVAVNASHSHDSLRADARQPTEFVCKGACKP